MTKLMSIWLEPGGKAIRIDWDNDRHQRIELTSGSPEGVAKALKEAGSLVNAERVQGEL